jgi:hypothetical protein
MHANVLGLTVPDMRENPRAFRVYSTGTYILIVQLCQDGVRGTWS